MNVIILVISLAIGVGITFFGTSILNDSGAVLIDQQMQIIVAVVITLFAYLSLYFMAKGRGGG